MSKVHAAFNVADVAGRDLLERREPLAAGVVIVRRPVVDVRGHQRADEADAECRRDQDPPHQKVNFSANCMMRGSPAVWI